MGCLAIFLSMELKQEVTAVIQRNQERVMKSILIVAKYPVHCDEGFSEIKNFGSCCNVYWLQEKGRWEMENAGS